MFPWSLNISIELQHLCGASGHWNCNSNNRCRIAQRRRRHYAISHDQDFLAKTFSAQSGLPGFKIHTLLQAKVMAWRRMGDWDRSWE
jgi:hypothetical protein